MSFDIEQIWLFMGNILVFYECFEFLAPCRMAQFSKRLGFDLPDPLTGDGKILAHLFQGVIGFFPDAEPHS